MTKIQISEPLHLLDPMLNLYGVVVRRCVGQRQFRLAVVGDHDEKPVRARAWNGIITRPKSGLAWPAVMVAPSSSRQFQFLWIRPSLRALPAHLLPPQSAWLHAAMYIMTSVHWWGGQWVNSLSSSPWFLLLFSLLLSNSWPGPLSSYRGGVPSPIVPAIRGCLLSHWRAIGLPWG